MKTWLAIVSTAIMSMASLSLLAAPLGGYRTVSMDAKFQGEDQGNSKFFGNKVKVLYLNQESRAALKITVKEGRLYDAFGILFDTAGQQAIFVMDAIGNIYASKYHTVGIFHHSSIMAGTPVAGAGEIEVQNGILMELNNRSGHYRPSIYYHQQVLARLKELGVTPSRQDVDTSGHIRMDISGITAADFSQKRAQFKNFEADLLNKFRRLNLKKFEPVHTIEIRAFGSRSNTSDCMIRALESSLELKSKVPRSLSALEFHAFDR